jgi:hypothetical protein
MPARHFRPVEELDACFVVRDHRKSPAFRELFSPMSCRITPSPYPRYVLQPATDEHGEWHAPSLHGDLPAVDAHAGDDLLPSAHQGAEIVGRHFAISILDLT